MPEQLIDSPIWYSLAITLFHFLWQGCVVALVLKGLLSITSYKNPQLRYTWATLAMIANIALPIITFYYIYTPGYLPLEQHVQLSPLLVSAANLTNSEASIWYQEIIEGLPYVSLSWLIAVIFLTLKLLIELGNVNRLANTNTMPAPEELSQRFELLLARFTLWKKPKLLISLQSEVPMAIGWLKPIVLLPAAMLSGLTPHQLDMLIMHELAHIRRHDYLVNFLQTLVEILLFFHPAVRWVSKQMRNEREYCSDDIAVKMCGCPIAYAHTLADTASLCTQHRHRSIPTMAMAASGGDLKQRVVRLIEKNHNCTNSNDSGKFLASLVIIFSIASVALQPYIGNTVIDLSSGRITLMQSATQFIQQRNYLEESTPLPETSIVEQLVQQSTQENFTNENDEPISAQQENIEQTTTNSVESSAQENQLVEQASAQAKPHIQTETSTEASNLDKLATEATPELAIQSYDGLPTNKQKSMSEVAFERTDSSANNSKLANPYAEQLAKLKGEPLLEVTKSIAAYDIDKAFITQSDLTAPTPSNMPNVEVEPIKPAKSPAKLVSSIEPKYPSAAKRKGIELDVTISFIIDKSGRVTDVEFEDKSKVSYFRSAIRNALKKWRFEPAKIDGQPVESKSTKIFSFSLIR